MFYFSANEPELQKDSETFIIYMFIFALTIAIIFGILLCTCWKNWRREKKRNTELERAKDAITQKWIKKVIVEKQESDASQEPLLVPTIKIERCQSRSHLGSEITSLSEYELPLDVAWELPRSKLLIGESLGEGAFGKVMKADAHGILRPDVPTTVAIKMLKGMFF